MFWLGLLLVACGVFLLVYGTMLFRFAIAVAGFVIGFALGWWLLESATEAAQIIVAFALGGVVAIVGYAVVRIGVYLAGGLLGALLALIVVSFLNIGSSVVNVLVVLAAAVAVGFFARSLGLWLTILATSAAGAYAIVYGLSRMFPDSTQIEDLESAKIPLTGAAFTILILTFAIGFLSQWTLARIQRRFVDAGPGQ
ncbi:MAG TPA: DUF4203 domain-containing protein [Acidimicrobiia bacterium]|jgi:hypothetical protein|nr:DUF4203 domain-containing protein [Acidimicrobiia bacterium]